MQVRTLLLLFGGIAFNLASAAPLSTPDGFSIELPPGWIQIPADAIASAEEQLRVKAPKSRQPHTDYAFQFGNRGQWFAYPYVLVNIDRKGRIPEAQLAASTKLSAASAAKNAQDVLENLATDLQIGQPRYDSKTHVVWMKFGLSAGNVGQVLGVSAIIATQSGHIDIKGYSLEKDYLAFANLLQDLVASVDLDASEKYQTVSSEDVPSLRSSKWDTLILSEIVGAVIAVVAGGRAWVKRK